MKIARVAGTVVSTVNAPVLDGHKLLLCEYETLGGESAGYTIAVDVVDAGVGERVLVLDEGTSARQILGLDWGAIRAVVVGIVDEVTLNT